MNQTHKIRTPISYQRSTNINKAFRYHLNVAYPFHLFHSILPHQAPPKPIDPAPKTPRVWMRMNWSPDGLLEPKPIDPAPNTPRVQMWMNRSPDGLLEPNNYLSSIHSFSSTKQLIEPHQVVGFFTKYHNRIELYIPMSSLKAQNFEFWVRVRFRLQHTFWQSRPCPALFLENSLQISSARIRVRFIRISSPSHPTVKIFCVADVFPATRPFREATEFPDINFTTNPRKREAESQRPFTNRENEEPSTLTRRNTDATPPISEVTMIRETNDQEK